jgi:hypothetical protein
MFNTVSRLVFISVRNGLIAGLLGFALVVALYYMNRHPFLFPIYFDFRIVLLAVFIVMTLKELRDDHQQGLLSFGQAMISSFLFTVVFATVASLLIWTFSAFVPGFVANYISLITEQMNSIEPEVIEQLGRSAFEQQLKQIPSTTGSSLAFDYVAKTFIISFFISIILSVILRRQPKNI